MDNLLEKKARNMEPGPHLDWICVKWMDTMDVDGTKHIDEWDSSPDSFSTKWSCAGELLDSIMTDKGKIWFQHEDGKHQIEAIIHFKDERSPHFEVATGDTIVHAISKMCAVLLSKDIKHSHLLNNTTEDL